MTILIFSIHQSSSDNGQIIQVGEKALVGKKGQLFDTQFIGTGQSQGTYQNNLFAVQSNDNIMQSESKKLLLDFKILDTAGRATAKKVDGLGSDLMRSQIFSNRVTTGRNGIKPTSSPPLILPEPNGHNMIRESSDIRGHVNRSKGNVTDVEKKVFIGPQGYANISTSIATENATNTGIDQTNDFQTHGEYEDSDIDFSTIIIAATNPLNG